MSSPTHPRLRVALVYGGRSGEHEISVRSAHSIRKGLDPARYDVSEFLIDGEGRWSPHAIQPDFAASSEIDVVFPALHGPFGEDGTIQGLLELAGIPYVGSGVLASALCMDKAMTKRVCREAGLPVVEFVTLTRGSFDENSLTAPFEFPVFVKPVNLGSSVGISKAKNLSELRSAVQTAAQYDRKLIVERGITGREFECAVLGGPEPRAATPCEIIPSQEFYTYEDKYILDTARIELPAKLNPEQVAEMQRIAIAAFEAVGCEGLARVDFLMEGKTGQLYVNEINTMPGFTSISMFPKMWEYSGIPFSDLLDRLIEFGLQRALQNRQTRFAR